MTQRDRPCSLGGNRKLGENTMMLPVVSIMLMARGQVTPADGYIGTSENAANGTVDLALNPPRGGRVMVDNVDVVSLIVF